MITKIDENTLKVTDVDKLIKTLDELRPRAKEMFKMLGYEPNNRIKEQEKGVISYNRAGVYNTGSIETEILEKEIRFYLEDKEVLIWEDYETVVGVTPDELTAINKQIEELGW